jgi:hypothetical protein
VNYQSVEQKDREKSLHKAATCGTRESGASLSNQVLLMERMLREGAAGTVTCCEAIRRTRTISPLIDRDREGRLVKSKPTVTASMVNVHTMPRSRQFNSHMPVLQPCTKTAPAEAAVPLSAMVTIARRVDSGDLIELCTCVNEEEFAA